VDQGDPNLINKEETIIRKIQPYIYKYKKAYFDLLSKRKDNPNIEGFVNTARRFLNFYENLKHGNMKETYMVNFFDKVEDFISHLKDNPAYKTMMFYLQP
jgi:GTP cyclohydrolase I